MQMMTTVLINMCVSGVAAMAEKRGVRMVIIHSHGTSLMDTCLLTRINICSLPPI